MDRLNQILRNKSYREYYNKIEKAEADRSFCLHDIQHFLAVARIAMLLNLQENLQIKQEFIYITSILHDIGRFEQYENGTPHEKASVILAEPILHESGFNDEEISIILEAIDNHRNKEVVGTGTLNDIIYRADKMSRNCFLCKMYQECNWKQDKKNDSLIL